MVDKNVFKSNDEENERDRNARGYGFEIGRGHPLTSEIETLSDDNPFVDKDWRKFIEYVTEDINQTFELNKAALDSEDEIEKTKTNDPFAGMKRAGEKNIN